MMATDYVENTAFEFNVSNVYEWVAWGENAVGDIRSTNEGAITWYKADWRNHDGI